MSPLIRNFNRAQLNMQVLNRVTSSLHTGVYQFSSLPSNVEELAAKEKVAFSSNRFRDLSKGVVQSQTVSVFGTSCMNNQMSQLDAGNARQVQSATNHLENYDSTGAISLSAAMRDNIPQPFAPVIDKTLTPNLSMPTGPTGQQNKYIASDMQETLHSGFERLQDIQKPKGNIYWMIRRPMHGNLKFCVKYIGTISSMRYYSTAKPDSTATKESTTERLKRAVRDYGATVIVFHVSISITSLGICYAAVASGLDIPGYLTQWGIGGEMLNSKLASGASTFIVAYAVHKIMAPIRISITLGSVPFIVRYLRKIGFIKKTSTPQ